MNPADWQESLYQVLKDGGVRQVAYVPDAGHAHLIRRAQADPDMRDIVLTTEEEGVALAAGAWLGGQRAALLMQSSGVGNCVNMFSLLRSCRFPFFALVTMRGEYAEFNPWQRPMGRSAQRAMELMGITVHRASAPGDVAEIASAALDSAFEGGRAGGGAAVAKAHRTQEMGARLMPPTTRPCVDRRAFVAKLMQGIPGALVVSGLGSPTYDVFAAGDRDRNFYLWGAMGGATPIGLGLALAQPEQSVVVITGDGEQLMGMGSLATVGAQRPANLTIVVLDNGHFGETGMQPSHTSLGTSLAAVAKGCGIEDAFAVDTPRRGRSGGATRERPSRNGIRGGVHLRGRTTAGPAVARRGPSQEPVPGAAGAIAFLSSPYLTVTVMVLLIAGPYEWWRAVGELQLQLVLAGLRA